MSAAFVIGVDVGGTFTDVFVLDEATGTATVNKVPSTKGDQSQGLVEGIRQKVPGFSGIQTVIHGTTVGTNALLERKGAPTGIITTKGFGDVLEMRRRDRPTTWGLRGAFTPVVPRNRRLEVSERVLAGRHAARGGGSGGGRGPGQGPGGCRLRGCLRLLHQRLCQ